MDGITVTTPIDFRTKYQLSIKTNNALTPSLPKPPAPSFQHLDVAAQCKVAALTTLSAVSFTAGILKTMNVLTPKLPDSGTYFAGAVFFGIQAMQALKRETENHTLTQQNKRSPEPRPQLKIPESVETSVDKDTADRVHSEPETDLTPLRLSPTDEPQSPPIRRSDSSSRLFQATHRSS